MANPEQVALLMRSIREWNEWRKANPEKWPDLKRANLSGADLTHADLNCVDLTDANLIAADLTGASLAEADLTCANLAEATLSNADLTHAKFINARLTNASLSAANLIGTDLIGANLSHAGLVAATVLDANLSQANLTEALILSASINGALLNGANFKNAMLSGTALANLDLSNAKALETVTHASPSTIGIDTIYRSRGKIPERFLRGAGVPESLITQIPSLVGAMEGIQFYSCFISHSHEDHEFCERLHSRMQQAHLRVWFSPHDMPWGKKLHEELETQIRLYDKLLLVLSPASMKSNWVKHEISKAFQCEREQNRRILFPIALCPFEEISQWEYFDSDLGKDLAKEIRQYLIPEDFTQWKDHDAFEAAFAKLMKALKAK